VSRTHLFAYRDRLVGEHAVAGVAVTDASIDLGPRTTREQAGVHLERIEASIGAVPVMMSQVHGNDVAVITEPHRLGQSPTADAMVTTTRGVALMATAADCVPVLLADPDIGVIGAAHSGRPGLAAGVATQTVAAMRDLGATRIIAWIGPHVCGGCYEVPEQLRDEVAALVPAAYAETTWGTPALDIGNGVRAQLSGAGVAEIRTVDRCTREDPQLHSYRRDGAASGRFAGMIWLESA
jgi:polyphenol oxidase